MEIVPPVSSPDIALLRSQRALFELAIGYNEEAIAIRQQEKEAEHEAQRLVQQGYYLDELLQAVPKQYQWLLTVDETQRNTLVAAFDSIHSYATETEKPSREVYLHFRKNIETDQTVSEIDATAVHLLEALMHGKIPNGSLPF